MNQPKKNSMRAQMSSRQSMEAAVKLVPQTSLTEDDGGPIDKDGFDGDSGIRSFDVQVATNGFFVTITYNDFEVPEERYVVDNMDEVVELMRSKF